MRMLKRVFALCFCLVLLAAAARGGNHPIDLSNGPDSWLSYQWTLPDGRMLLCGGNNEVGDGVETGARLLCLDPDGTVDWEYIDPEKGVCCFSALAVRKDGTIAAVFAETTDDFLTQMTLKFFTQDGKPAGKEIRLPKGDRRVYSASESCLRLVRYRTLDTDTGPDCWNEVLDWNGRVLARHEGYGFPDGVFDMAEAEGGVLLAGRDSESDNAHAKIMKLDGVPGKTLWETTLDYQWPDTRYAEIESAAPAGDGGYAALLWERYSVDGSDMYYWKDAVMKFDSGGRVLWTDWENPEGRNLAYQDLAVYNGKIVVYTLPEEQYGGRLDIPRSFRWFGPDGEDLGTTELVLEPEDFPGLQTYLETAAGGRPVIPEIDRLELIPAAGGLWALVSGYAGKDGKEDFPHDTILVRIPEP